MKAYRIAGGSYPVFDAAGAELYGGRWNSAGRPVIYAGESFAIAMLERLVYTGIGRVPRDSRYVEIEIPDDLPVETVALLDLPGWDSADLAASRAFGDRWQAEGRGAVLSVPSVVTGIDRNLVLNPRHADFARLIAGAEQPVTWDRRLFSRPA